MAWAGLLLPLLSVGCSDPQIEEYTVPKGSEVIAAAGAPQATPPHAHDHAVAGGGAAPTATDGGASVGDQSTATARWVVPQGWREVDAPMPMRLTTFVLMDEGEPVEVAVTRFPGSMDDLGGMLANVNRWREQIGLPPVGDADLPEQLTSLITPGFEGRLIHLQGPAQDMVVASLYESAMNRTWFVRMVAEHEVAQRVKPAVVAFARSFGTAEAATPQQE